MKHTTEEVVLKNGLKGLVIRVPDASVVSIEISFRAGEFLLERAKWETAHLMEHLMSEANTTFTTSRAFQAELEKNGAYSNASTSVYDITYEIECAAFEAERVLELLVRALEKPLFNQNEFTAEFGNVSEELVGRSNNHFRALNLGLRESLGLCGLTDRERVELIHNVTIQDVQKHYENTHSVANARFIIAGGIADTQLAILESLHLGTSTKRIEMPDETPRAGTEPIIIHRGDVPNYYFYIDSYAGRSLQVNECDALAVASTLLTDTLHSKLLGTARERGLVYAMGSGQQHIKTNSSFWLGAQVSKKNCSELFILIRDVLQDFAKNGVSAVELDAAKQYMLGRHERSAQTVSGVLSSYSTSYYLDDYIEDEQNYQPRIEGVTNELLVSSFRAVLQGGVWALGLLGSLSKAESDEFRNILAPLFTKPL